MSMDYVEKLLIVMGALIILSGLYLGLMEDYLFALVQIGIGVHCIKVVIAWKRADELLRKTTSEVKKRG